MYEKIFNSSTFSKMKDGVCFINAGRGRHVEEKDLLVFTKNKIKLAILDVFCDEPLKEISSSLKELKKKL